jgi:triacylglycerol lipase
LTTVFPRLDAPLVLAHGLCGFRRLGFGPIALTDYFRALPSLMRAAGNTVVLPKVHPTGCIERRAAKLARDLERMLPDDQPFHFIGHSMGGLDARELLIQPRWRKRFLSLTCIATPHLGTTLADLGLHKLGVIHRAVTAVGWDAGGFQAITRDQAARFHDCHPLPNDLPCFSIPADPPEQDVLFWLKPWYRILMETDGPNDGLVPAQSAAAFGTILPAWPIDHLRQMNWYTGRLGHSRLSRQVLSHYIHLLHHLANLSQSRPAEPVEVVPELEEAVLGQPLVTQPLTV